jgi:hypothetical protein
VYESSVQAYLFACRHIVVCVSVSYFYSKTVPDFGTHNIPIYIIYHRVSCSIYKYNRCLLTFRGRGVFYFCRLMSKKNIYWPERWKTIFWPCGFQREDLEKLKRKTQIFHVCKKIIFGFVRAKHFNLNLGKSVVTLS